MTGQPAANPASPQRSDTWRLVIPDFFPKSLNRTQDKHWSHRHRTKRHICNLLMASCLEHGGVPRFEGFVWVTITRLWGKGQRALDKVNLYGAVKGLEDCLRQRKQVGRGWQGGLGIIQDDDPKNCSITVNQRRNDIDEFKDRQCTMIVIQGKRIEP